MVRYAFSIGFLCVVLFAGSVFPAEKKDIIDRRSTQNAKIVVAGKLFCSLKRQVIIPYHGIITLLRSRSGDQVKKGMVLADYRLWPQDALNLRRRLSSFHITDLEMRLADVENALTDLEGKNGKLHELEGELRLAETEKNLTDLEERQKEIKSLVDNGLAPTASLSKINREIELLSKRQKLIQQTIPLEQKRLNRHLELLTKKRELIQERLPLERSLAEEDRTVIEGLMGNSVRNGQIPKRSHLVSPIDGHVIWVHPDFRKDAEFRGGTRVFWVGVMNPMLIRARVHGIEVVQVAVGDVCEFSLEAFPGRKFEARVSQVSWATTNLQLDQPSYYDVELVVKNPAFILREGLNGQILFPPKK